MSDQRMDQQVRTKVDATTFDRLHALAKQERSTVAREARLAILDRINARLGDPSPGYSVAVETVEAIAGKDKDGNYTYKKIAVQNARDEFRSEAA